MKEIKEKQESSAQSSTLNISKEVRICANVSNAANM